MNLKETKKAFIIASVYLLSDISLTLMSNAAIGTAKETSKVSTIGGTYAPYKDKDNNSILSKMLDIEIRSQLVVFTKTSKTEALSQLKKLGIESPNITESNGAFYHRNSTIYIFLHHYILILFLLILLEVFKHRRNKKKIKKFNTFLNMLDRQANKNKIDKAIETLNISAEVKQILTVANNKKQEFFNELQTYERNLTITEAKIEFLNLCLNNQFQETKLHEYRFQELMHEVTTPLSATTKLISRLKKTVDHKTYPLIKEIHDNSSFALVATQIALRKHLLGDKSETLSSINIRELIEQSFKMATNGSRNELPNIDLDINISSNHSSKAINLISDKTILQSIFINLFNNSLKYSNKSKLIVTINHNISETKKSASTSVTIDDEGQGFSDEFLNKHKINEQRKIEDASFGIGLQLVNEYLAKLNSSISLSNIRDRNETITGARCAFKIETLYTPQVQDKFNKNCSAAVFTEDKKLRNKVQTIFNEKGVKINFVSDDELEISSINTVLLIDYSLEKFTTRDIRLAATQHNDITVLLMCGTEEYKLVQECDILLPYTCEDTDIKYDNIYAIPKPVTSEEIFTILNETKGLDNSVFSKQNLDALIIEDHKIEREGLTAFLGKCFNVKVTKDLSEAAKCLNHFNFDVIISDINFSDGVLIEKIEKQLTKSKGLKIVHTGMQPKSQRINSINHMFDAVIQKSCDYSELTHIIEKHFKLGMPKEEPTEEKAKNEHKTEFFNLKTKIENIEFQKNFPNYVALIHRTVNTLNKIGIVDGDEEELMFHEHTLHLNRKVTVEDHSKTLRLLNALSTVVKSS